MNLNGKRVDLAQLQAELATAGITVPALGTAGEDLHTYDEDGAAIDMPPESAAVLEAHDPAPPPPPVTLDDVIAAAVARALAERGLK
jgi:hypothetical protein